MQRGIFSIATVKSDAVRTDLNQNFFSECLDNRGIKFRDESFLNRGAKLADLNQIFFFSECLVSLIRIGLRHENDSSRISENSFPVNSTIYCCCVIQATQQVTTRYDRRYLVLQWKG